MLETTFRKVAGLRPNREYTELKNTVKIIYKRSTNGKVVYTFHLNVNESKPKLVESTNYKFLLSNYKKM